MLLSQVLSHTGQIKIAPPSKARSRGQLQMGVNQGSSAPVQSPALGLQLRSSTCFKVNQDEKLDFKKLRLQTDEVLSRWIVIIWLSPI